MTTTGDTSITPVDDPVDDVDTQVSGPEAASVSSRGSEGAAPGSAPAAEADEPPWWSINRSTRQEPEAPAPTAPRDSKPGWWDRLYQGQDADLDTHTGRPRTGPAVDVPTEIKAEKTAPADRSGGLPDVVVPPDRQEVFVPEPAVVPFPPVHVRLRSRAWRVLAFNGSAAATGFAVGLGAYLSQFPESAVAAAGGLLGTCLAFGGGFAAWKVAGSELCSPFVPFGPYGRIGAVLAAAEGGRRLGQQTLPYISHTIGHSIGLDQTDTALLVVGCAMCGLSGWLVWRTRASSWLVRWLSRIPLASSLVACALYSSGPVI